MPNSFKQSEARDTSSGSLAAVLRTATFRLAAIYAGAFAGLLLASAVFVYFLSHSALERQLQNRISAELDVLKSDYSGGGYTKLLSAVRDREKTHPSGPLKYWVSDSSGSRIAGDMPEAPKTSGWSHLNIREGDGDLARFAVLIAPLPGGVAVAVAGNLEDIDEARDVVFETFSAALATVLILGLIGGLALGAAVLRRVNAVTRTANAIIEGGDLSLRVPVQGTGDDFDRLAATLNRMLEQIGHLMSSMRQVSNDIAHDLHTPLARLRQRLERALAVDGSAAEYKSAVQGSLREVDEILATFGALLRIAQVEAGARRSGFRRTDLGQVFSSVADAFSPSAEEASHSIATQCDPNCFINGDRELLTQMAANLIENALVHTPGGARIRVTVTRAPEGIVARIGDNGAGIPEGERDRVFRRFYRLDKSRSTPGNGLGLSMVAAIAELHDAELDLQDNRPGLLVEMRFSEWSNPTRASEGARQQHAPADKSSDSQRPIGRSFTRGRLGERPWRMALQTTEHEFKAANVL